MSEKENFSAAIREKNIATVTNPKYKFYYFDTERVSGLLYDSVSAMLYEEGMKIIRQENELLAREHEEAGNSSNIQAQDQTMTATTGTSDQLNVDGPSVSSFLVRNNIASSLMERIDNDKNRVLLNEITQYLHAPTSDDIIGELNKFPIIKKIYQKYACVRTSEAICERMFSYAGE